MGAEAAATAQASASLFYIFDVSLVLLLFFVKVPMLSGILTALSRREADARPRKCALAAALLGSAYFLCNTAPEAVLSLRAFLLVALGGALLFRKLFWINLEKSFVSCLLYGCLSILMSSYMQRWVDRLVPDRITVGRAMAQSIDGHVRQNARDASLPPSTGVMPALLRLAMTPGSDGVADTLLSPLRTAQRAKAQIADISKAKSEEASIVNMLAGAGTNVGSRKEELAALHNGLVAEAGGGSAPSNPAAPPGETPPPGAAPAPTTTVLAAAAAPPITASPAVSPLRAAPPPTPAPPPAAVAPAAAASASRIATVRLSGLDGMGPEERQGWESARRQIRVSSVGWSGTDAYIMVNRRVLRVGATHTVVYQGNEYVFRFRSVNRQGVCTWDPVMPRDEPTRVSIAF